VQGLYNACVWEFSNLGDGGEEKVGSRVAFVFVGLGVATLTGAPVGGALIGGEGGWLGGQVFAGGSVGVGFLCLGAARWMREGWGAGRI